MHFDSVIECESAMRGCAIGRNHPTAVHLPSIYYNDTKRKVRDERIDLIDSIIYRSNIKDNNYNTGDRLKLWLHCR